MIGSLAFSVDWLSRNSPASVTNFVRFFDYYWEVVLALDVILAVVGYVCSLRLLGTEVVLTDETWRGWTATLICYAPFSTVLYGSYLTYEDGLRWGDVFAHPTLYVIYGCTLLLVQTLYLVASLNFGIRYSNLSHRGILTDGLFRLTKHPAYLFKQITWWMVALPFLSRTSWVDAALNCALLLAVNAVYWWRGRTEEINLSRDPAYVAYALAMNDRSVLRHVGKTFPVFSYRLSGTSRRTS
jgi:protein-S-isoprenylcysteine O-methyltransferase Ste14